MAQLKPYSMSSAAPCYTSITTMACAVSKIEPHWLFFLFWFRFLQEAFVVFLRIVFDHRKDEVVNVEHERFELQEDGSPQDSAHNKRDANRRSHSGLELGPQLYKRRTWAARLANSNHAQLESRKNKEVNEGADESEKVVF